VTVQRIFDWITAKTPRLLSFIEKLLFAAQGEGGGTWRSASRDAC
jgi:hypothetical protein